MTTESMEAALTTSTLQRPSRVLRAVVREHAEEAGFLWALRTHAVGAPQYDLQGLMALDERIEAHLDGLRIAGDVAWEICAAKMEEPEPGDVFTLGVLAFGGRDKARATAALQAGSASALVLSELVGAMAWFAFDEIADWVRALLGSSAGVGRALGIAACVQHGRDPGAMLATALADDDPLVRLWTLRAVGALNRRDLAEALAVGLGDGDEACRFWAAWSLSLLGKADGWPVLMHMVELGGRFRERALQVALRAMEGADARQWVRRLAAKPGFERLVVMAAGVIGDPAATPWLIEQMQNPALARLAGEAFATLTGFDCKPPRPGPGQKGAIPDAAPEDEEDAAQAAEAVQADPDAQRWLPYEEGLSLPSAALAAQWWHAERHRFSAGERYLRGQPLTVESARATLVEGRQRERAGAALELAIRTPDEILFDVGARAPWQARRLNVSL